MKITRPITPVPPAFAKPTSGPRTDKSVLLAIARALAIQTVNEHHGQPAHKEVPR